MNKIYCGDNLVVMKQLESKSIDLIAADPPFNSGRNYGDFDDRFESITHYLQFMRPRLIECHRLLKDTGSLYLHCDQSASHYLKCELDIIFERKNFRNDITWKKLQGRKNNTKSRFFSQTDSILFYVKTNAAIFNPIYRPITDEELETKFKHVDKNGRRYNPSGGRYFQKHGINKKVYLDESPGMIIGSLWAEDGTELNTNSNERIGYPTQKPRSLYERIITASSNIGDLVLDPFCGSGTTLSAAQSLGRYYIGIEQNKNAIAVIEQRLEKEHGMFLDPYEVINAEEMIQNDARS